jgi:hypothetical protein
VELFQELNRAVLEWTPALLFDPLAQARYYTTVFSQMAKFQGRLVLWALMSADEIEASVETPVPRLRSIA